MLHARISGLSGNEMYCLAQQHYRPGPLCVGNSVVALGVVGGLGASLATLVGGEVSAVTQLVHDARQQALQRLIDEQHAHHMAGVVGISLDLVRHEGNLEFLCVGSAIAAETEAGAAAPAFSCGSDGQGLYCLRDCGFVPQRFVFGNVAYALGVGGALGGLLRRLQRGEVPQYSAVFARTRKLALTRLLAEATRCHAQAVVAIRTVITPLLGTHEMMMSGTAVQHPLLQNATGEPASSDLTPEETWNLCQLGYLPVRLLMGVSVCSLGVVGTVMAALRQLWGGEVGALREVLYTARAAALQRIEAERQTCGAEAVVGVKVHVYHLGGGLVEFLAMGTAVRKVAGAGTTGAQLPVQAVVRDQDTFVHSGAWQHNNLLAGGLAGAEQTQGGSARAARRTLRWLMWISLGASLLLAKSLCFAFPAPVWGF